VGLSAMAIGAGIAAYLGFSHPAGKPTPSSPLQFVGVALLIGGFFLAVMNLFLAFCWRAASTALATQQPRELSMTSTDVLTGTRSGVRRVPYAVVFRAGPPDVPLAVMQSLSGARSLPNPSSKVDILFFGDRSRDKVMLAVNRDGTTVVGWNNRRTERSSAILQTLGMGWRAEIT
jgi:hypothetical protein